MNIADIGLIVVILSLAVHGWRRGFIESMGQLIAAVASFVVARFETVWLGGWLQHWLGGQRAALNVVAFILIFVCVDALVAWLFRWLNRAFDLLSWIPFLGGINALMGAIVGMVEGVWLAGATAYVVEHWQFSEPFTQLFALSRVAQFCLPLFAPFLRIL